MSSRTVEDLDDLDEPDVFGLTGEAVAASLPANGRDHPRPVQVEEDLRQVLCRDAGQH